MTNPASAGFLIYTTPAPIKKVPHERDLISDYIVHGVYL